MVHGDLLADAHLHSLVGNALLEADVVLVHVIAILRIVGDIRIQQRVVLVLHLKKRDGHIAIVGGSQHGVAHILGQFALRDFQHSGRFSRLGSRSLGRLSGRFGSRSLGRRCGRGLSRRCGRLGSRRLGRRGGGRRSSLLVLGGAAAQHKQQRQHKRKQLHLLHIFSSLHVNNRSSHGIHYTRRITKTQRFAEIATDGSTAIHNCSIIVQAFIPARRQIHGYV